MKFLLDTNICIYALNERPRSVLDRLQAVRPSEVAVSVVTLFELRFGAEKSRDPLAMHARLDHLLRPLRLLPFEEEAAWRAARVRTYLEGKGLRIGEYDTLLAGHALSQGLTLVTNNLREFDRVPGLKTENWAS